MQISDNKYVIWLFGLSGAGKTTLALKLIKYFEGKNLPVFHLDGDVLRQGLNNDLGFSEKDRHENLRRAAEVAKLFREAGKNVIASFITPFETDRKNIEKIIGKNNLYFVYLKCSIEECEHRDPKGLYRKVRKGELKSFTGISDIFEEPSCSNLIVETDKDNVEACFEKIKKELFEQY